MFYVVYVTEAGHPIEFARHRSRAAAVRSMRRLAGLRRSGRVSRQLVAGRVDLRGGRQPRRARLRALRLHATPRAVSTRARRTRSLAMKHAPVPVSAPPNAGRFGVRDAVAAGRVGGTVSSAAKTAAARANGKKGGRPRKPR